MSSNEDAIISIPVKLVSDVSGDPVAEKQEKSGFFDLDDDTKKLVKDDVDTEIKDAVKAVLSDEDIDVDKLANITKGLGDIQSQGLSTVRNVATNPQGFIQNNLISVLGRAGPYGAIAAAIIGIVISSPEVFKQIVKMLGTKGGPLNQDWRLAQDSQYGQQFNRATQFRRQTGDNPIITVQDKGFIVGDPDFVLNSLVDTNKARTGRIGLQFTSLRNV